jgi:Fur family ferric uptake transcriptional regulator
MPGIMEPLCAVFRRRLRGEGLKYTPERAAVLEAVLAFEGLFQAEALIESLKRERLRVSKATVYRTIKLLQDAGIIQRVPFDDEQAHYHVAYGKAPEDLLIRLDTKELVAVDVPEVAALRDALCARLGLRARGHRLQIFAEKA